MAIKIYEPASGPAVLGASSLRGRRVVLLGDSWPSWQTMLSYYEKVELKGVRGTAEVGHWSIPLSSATAATIEEAAEGSDLVMLGWHS